MVFLNWFRVPYMWIKLCYRAAHAEKYSDYEHFTFLKYITHHANQAGKVSVVVSGKENIPRDDGFIFYPNHQGMYDVLALLEASDKPVSVVIKKEAANNLFLKQVIACMKAYVMDRQDIRQSLQVIMNVANEVKQGRNYVIFAEGTRSKMGNKTLDFKGGSFKAATKAKCPVVPVALLNSYKPFDTHDTTPVSVYVNFLEPICYEEYKDMKTTELAVLVKEKIDRKIEECLCRENLT